MSEAERIAETLLLAMDGDFLPGAGMSCDNAGQDVPMRDASPKEIAWWVAGVLTGPPEPEDANHMARHYLETLLNMQPSPELRAIVEQQLRDLGEPPRPPS